MPLIENKDELPNLDVCPAPTTELLALFTEAAEVEVGKPPSLDTRHLPLGVWIGPEVKSTDFCTADIETVKVHVDPLTDKEVWLPVCCCIYNHTQNAWSVWLSPLLEPGSPIEDAPTIVPLPEYKVSNAHNGSYDRARCKLHPLMYWWDTRAVMMALHGLSNQQRIAYKACEKILNELDAYRQGTLQREVVARSEDEETGEVTLKYGDQILSDVLDEGLDIHPLVEGEPTEELIGYLAKRKGVNNVDWYHHGSEGSLAAAVKYYFGEKLDKTVREELLVKGDVEGVRSHIGEILTYCMSDVWWTARVFQESWKEFREAAPSWISFSGVLAQSREFIPMREGWFEWLANVNRQFNKVNDEISSHIVEIAQDVMDRYHQGEDMGAHPWFSQLDWKEVSLQLSVEDLRDWKNFKTGDAITSSKIPWEVDLSTFDWNKDYETIVKPTLENGFYLQQLKTKQKEVRPKQFKTKIPNWFKTLTPTLKARTTPALMQLEYKTEDRGYVTMVWDDNLGWTADGAEIPNPDPLAKGKPTQLYGKYWRPKFEGENPQIKAPDFVRDTILPKLASVSVFAMYRKRLANQQFQQIEGIGDVIVPDLVTMGTISRRSTDPTWKTIPNADSYYEKDENGKDDLTKPIPDIRLGVEAKTWIQAPEGFRIVGGDIDSEEAWLYSLMGDSLVGIPGSTGLGRQVLLGNKKDRTDLHTYIADQVDMSRGDAKGRNYARMYGEGLKACAKQLASATGKSLDECSEIAEAMFAGTKGTKVRGCWSGGTESEAFNKLDDYCSADVPRTPTLGVAMTQALQPRYTQCKNKWGKYGPDFVTTLGNWFIQSSGVDYMHCWLTGVDIAAAEVGLVYGVDYWLAITIHDEASWCVKESLAVEFALLVQKAHLAVRLKITRAFGVPHLPVGCAWMSSVEIDTNKRKSADAHSMTASSNLRLEPGLAFSPARLLEVSNTKQK